VARCCRPATADHSPLLLAALQSALIKFSKFRIFLFHGLYGWWSMLDILHVGSKCLHCDIWIFEKKKKKNETCALLLSFSLAKTNIFRQNFFTELLGSSNYLESGQWTKSKNPVILCVIQNRQNPIENVFSLCDTSTIIWQAGCCAMIMKCLFEMSC
jgi:hypothetical protein